MPRPLYLTLSIGAVAAVGALVPEPLPQAQAAAARANPQTVNRNVRVRAEPEAIEGFEDDARFRLACRNTAQRPIGLGIRRADRHLADTDLGRRAATGYAVGVAGTTRLGLQVLCASPGSGVTYRSREGEPRRGRLASSRRGISSTATVDCGPGAYALGAALSSQVAPVTGAFRSGPVDGGHGWQVDARGIAASFPADERAPTRADVACVSTSVLRDYETRYVSTTRLAAARSTAFTVRCTGGRRVLGWGVRLSPVAKGRDGFAVPRVRRAEFRTAGSMRFTLALPPGAKSSGRRRGEPRQVATIICGRLTRWR